MTEILFVKVSKIKIKYNVNTIQMSWQFPENDEIPRHVPDNPYKYTKVQLAERKKALRDLARDYPNVPYAWLEMTYDWEKNTPPEEVEKIINEGLWEVPGKFSEPPKIENEYIETPNKQ